MADSREFPGIPEREFPVALIESPYTTILHRPLIVTFAHIFNRFGNTAGFVRPVSIFPYPIPILVKIWGVLFGVDP